ncbi:hypothetical protein ACE193_08305 [Bernardetia sp. OM2101]|uniref:hypothetical protein n=1 Tax=Bernardetia sp. OM2101 TaxID=3344876 RepID=UPI0035CF4533
MFSEKYPNLEYWVDAQGWIELGSDENSDSWIRIMDTGGLCYEDEDSSSLDEALEKAERWAAEENEE